MSPLKYMFSDEHRGSKILIQSSFGKLIFFSKFQKGKEEVSLRLSHISENLADEEENVGKIYPPSR